MRIAALAAGESALANGLARSSAGVGCAITYPYVTAIVTILYFDQRVRKEGLDLQLMAEGLGVERDPDSRAGAAVGAAPYTPERPRRAVLATAARAGSRRRRAGSRRSSGRPRPAGRRRPRRRRAPPPRAPGDAAAGRAARATAPPPGAAADGPPPTARARRPPSPPRAPPDDGRRRATATSAPAPSGLRPTSRAGPEGCEPRPRRGRRARPRGRGWSVAGRRAAPPRSPRRSSGRSRGEAVDDPAALAELRAVDVVDGQQVDVAARCTARAATASTCGCATLGRRSPAAEPLAIDPRARGARRARRGSLPRDDVPRPFWGFFELARATCCPSFDWLDDLSRAAGGRLARARGARRRCRVGRRAARPHAAHRASPRPRRRAAARRDGPARARAAGRRGGGRRRLEPALRLRFRAGLLRLDARGAIEYRPSISTREVRRKLRSEDFDALAVTFDDVVYGGRPPADATSRRRARAGPRQVVGSG